jgi:hypothetical protein
LIAVAFFLIARRHFGKAWLPFLFALLMAAYGLPVAWQNVVAGFHSQQFFLIGTALAAIVLLPGAAPWSGSWWFGTAAVVLALGSMASGLFAAAIVVGLLAVRLWRGEVAWKLAAPAFVLSATVVVIGWFAHVTVPYHEVYKAHNLQDFGMTMVRGLAWPATGVPWLGVMLWWPWCWHIWALLAHGKSDDRAFDYSLAGLGAWVLLQIAAIAYARGSGGPPPESRYVDTLAFGMVINAFIAVRAWHGRTRGMAARIVLAAAGLAWALTAAAGIFHETRSSILQGLEPYKGYRFYCVQNVHNYLASGDEAYLRHNEIPYPGTAGLLERMNIPALKALLPASVRLDLPLAPATLSGPFRVYDSRAPEETIARRARSPANAPAGLSTRTPALSNAVTWGSFPAAGPPVPGTWESNPVRASIGGWLRFQVAGQAGEPGIALELRDASDHRLLADVRTDRVPGDSWRSAYVKAPNSEFIVLARAAEPGKWLAFSRPVEMGTLSYWAWRAVKKGRLIAEIAGGAAILLGIAAAWPWRGARS